KRTEDIVPLARHFLAHHDPTMRFSDAALDALLMHSWPGNIRELRNVITKAAVMAQSPVIHAEDLPLAIHPPAGSNGHTPAGKLDGMERRMIMEALAATGGHQQKAAAKLGISRRTLSRKLKLYESEGVQAAV